MMFTSFTALFIFMIYDGEPSGILLGIGGLAITTPYIYYDIKVILEKRRRNK